jgi:peptidoglycan/xylan/chitin deacetylase (PgdA/CDA1 family)
MVLIAISLYLVPACVHGDSDATSRIAKWKNNAKAALSITIDDAGNANDRDVQAHILEEYGIRGTFHIPTGLVGARTHVFLDMFQRGHELGSHGVSHTDLKGTSSDHIWLELSESKQFIEDLTGSPCVSYCHPYGGWDANVVSAAEQLYLSARGVSTLNGINGGPGSNMYDLRVAPWPTPWPEASWTDEEYARNLREYVEKAIAAEGWGIEMWHNLSPDSSSGRSTGAMVNETAWRMHLAELATNYAESVWIAPQGAVARYFLERQETAVNTYRPASSMILVDLLCDKDKRLFNEPLTVITRIPKDWHSGPFKIMQAGNWLEHTLGMASIDLMAKIVVTGNMSPDVTGTYRKMSSPFNGKAAYKHESREYYIWSTSKEYIFENYFLSPYLGSYASDSWYSGARTTPVGAYYEYKPNAAGRPIATALPGEEEQCLLYDALPGMGGVTIWYEPTE